MIKKAFNNLSPERRAEIFHEGMQLYIESPFEEVTIRRIVEAVHINMATFYRYFDEKEDLPIEIFRSIYARFVKRDVNVFRAQIPMTELDETERAFCACTEMWPEYMRRRMVFDVECEFALPLVKTSLQRERLDGNLRNNVVEDFAAYMYVTAAYNFYCYCKKYELTDTETINKLWMYMDRSLFLEGIMLPEAEKKNGR